MSSKANESTGRTLQIAVEGCCHGELDQIYNSIRIAASRGFRTDLLLICGDFQCVRNSADFQSVAVPPKFRRVKNFQDYVTGVRVAPVLTIFIGGNHEASNILQSLYYGGFVAPNIYFLGFAGVVWFGGIRIAGLSGIFNEYHYRLGRYEAPPYTEDSVRSIYHLREVEVYRLAHMKLSPHPIDLFLSHDWPSGIVDYGNKTALLKKKPFLKNDIASGKLGSPPLMHLLQLLQPSYWFAAHLHVKFTAVVPHTTTLPLSTTTTTTTHHKPQSEKLSETTSISSTCIQGSSRDHFSDPNTADDTSTKFDSFHGAQVDRRVHETRFLALDKVLPSREFIDFMSVPVRHQNVTTSGVPDHQFQHQALELTYDPEWLALLRRTHTLTQVTKQHILVPDLVCPLSAQEIADVDSAIRHNNGGSLVIRNIHPLAHYSADDAINQLHKRPRSNKTYSEVRSAMPIICEPVRIGNPQTDWLLSVLGLPHICTVPHCGNYSNINDSSIGNNQGTPPTPERSPHSASYGVGPNQLLNQLSTAGISSRADLLGSASDDSIGEEIESRSVCENIGLDRRSHRYTESSPQPVSDSSGGGLTGMTDLTGHSVNSDLSGTDGRFNGIATPSPIFTMSRDDQSFATQRAATAQTPTTIGTLDRDDQSTSGSLHTRANPISFGTIGGDDQSFFSGVNAMSLGNDDQSEQQSIATGRCMSSAISTGTLDDQFSLITTLPQRVMTPTTIGTPTNRDFESYSFADGDDTMTIGSAGQLSVSASVSATSDPNEISIDD